MVAIKQRPRGLPAIDRMNADQLRGEVLRLSGNSDRYRHDAEQLRIANAALLAALEAIVDLPGFEPDEPYGKAALAAIAAAKGE